MTRVRQIDPATADWAALAALHARAFAEPWEAGALLRLAEGLGAAVLEADGDEGVEGFVMLRAAAGEAEILTVAVDGPARRKGVGRELMKGAMRVAASLGARHMFLEVSRANAPARALYAGLGFAEVGARPKYYAGEGAAADALILRAPLAPRG